MDVIALWCAIATAIAGGAALLGRLLLGARKMVTRIDEFMDDWAGTEARPGVPERPGVMARLGAIEHQLKPNSGESLRDAVNRIEAQITSRTPPTT